MLWTPLKLNVAKTAQLQSSFVGQPVEDPALSLPSWVTAVGQVQPLARELPHAEGMTKTKKEISSALEMGAGFQELVLYNFTHYIY